MAVAARRIFVVAWVALGLAGALDHTIAQRLLGRRLDLLLPHLKYGYVMFNLNPHVVHVYEYSGADGTRRNLADLVATPAPGYKRARLAIDAAMKPEYLAEVCYRVTRASHQAYDFIISEYDVDVSARTPSRTNVLHCDTRGLVDADAARSR
jgi:hypothetical protein